MSQIATELRYAIFDKWVWVGFGPAISRSINIYTCRCNAVPIYLTATLAYSALNQVYPLNNRKRLPTYPNRTWTASHLKVNAGYLALHLTNERTAWSRWSRYRRYLLWNSLAIFRNIKYMNLRSDVQNESDIHSSNLLKPFAATNRHEGSSGWKLYALRGVADKYWNC